MYKMAVIGETDTIYAFRAIGFDTFVIEIEEAYEVLRKKFKSGKYAVIFLSEALAQGMEELLEELGHKSFPVITILPNVRGRMNIGIENLKKISIKATGTDIISKMK